MTRLCSLEMGEENKKNCVTWSVDIPSLSQIWRGVWGNAPCSLQEQGFKGLAPWCINNLLEFQQPVLTSKWPVLEYQHCFTTTKWSPLINDRTMSHHCLITIAAKCQSCIRGHNFCAPSHCYSCTINVIADAQHSFFFKIITIYPIYPQNTLHLSHINSHHISYFFPLQSGIVHSPMPSAGVRCCQPSGVKVSHKSYGTLVLRLIQEFFN